MFWDSASVFVLSPVFCRTAGGVERVYHQDSQMFWLGGAISGFVFVCQ